MQICYMKYKPNQYITQEEKFIEFKIKDCRRFLTTASTLLGVALFNVQKCYALGGEEILKRVDYVGWDLFGIAKGIGFWGAVLFMVIDVIKSIKKEDISGIVRIAIKYSVWYAVIYFAPQIIKMIVILFEG